MFTVKDIKIYNKQILTKVKVEKPFKFQMKKALRQKALLKIKKGQQ